MRDTCAALGSAPRGNEVLVLGDSSCRKRRSVAVARHIQAPCQARKVRKADLTHLTPGEPGEPGDAGHTEIAFRRFASTIGNSDPLKQILRSKKTKHLIAWLRFLFRMHNSQQPCVPSKMHPVSALGCYRISWLSFTSLRVPFCAQPHPISYPITSFQSVSLHLQLASPGGIRCRN